MDKRRKLAWIIIGTSLSVLIIIFSIKQIITTPAVCDPKIISKTVILLDHSESIASQTREAIVERAWKHIDEKVPSGELISIYEITKLSKSNLHPSFEACKPRSKGSQSVENINKVKHDFENFKKKIRDELNSSIKELNEPAESPIAQAVIDLSLDDKHFRSTGTTKLLIFSDFLEYTPKFSLYTCNDGSRAIKDFRASRIGAVERPTFTNVDIQMHIIPRDLSNRALISCRAYFWNWFFGNNQGTLTPDELPG